MTSPAYSLVRLQSTQSLRESAAQPSCRSTIALSLSLSGEGEVGSSCISHTWIHTHMHTNTYTHTHSLSHTQDFGRMSTQMVKGFLRYLQIAAQADIIIEKRVGWYDICVIYVVLSVVAQGLFVHSVTYTHTHTHTLSLSLSLSASLLRLLSRARASCIERFFLQKRRM